MTGAYAEKKYNTFKHYMRRCKKCGVIFISMSKAGKICDACKLITYNKQFKRC